jgi:hypothetical protein
MKAHRFYEQFLINRKHRFIYCFVPKVACSSLKRWFVRVAGIPPESVVPEVHLFVAENFSLARLSEREAEELLRSKDYYRFAFQRNPFARLVSAYLDKLVEPKGPGLAPIRRVQRGPLWDVPRRIRYEFRRLTTGRCADFQQGITFREFVYHVASSTSPRRLDTHWRPQSLILGDVQFDFIGLMETMRPDFDHVCQQLGLDSDLPLTNCNRKSKTDAPTGCVADWPTSQLRELDSYPPFERFYTPELTKIVQRLYRHDCAAFEQLSQRSRCRKSGVERTAEAA